MSGGTLNENNTHPQFTALSSHMKMISTVSRGFELKASRYSLLARAFNAAPPTLSRRLLHATKHKHKLTHTTRIIILPQKCVRVKRAFATADLPNGTNKMHRNYLYIIRR